VNKIIRSLLFSSLYPSSVRPGHGIFVETRLRELIASGRVEARVVAPVPWFFSTHPRFGSYAVMAQTPTFEAWNGIDVSHPRYVLPPKVGMTLAPLSMALGALPCLRRLLHEGFDFDLIDAHYYYPDGVAAVLLAQWLGKPVAVTARGSDLNLIAKYPLPRRMIQWAASHADASIGVSNALADILHGWGVPSNRLHVMRNGVDGQRFRLLPQTQAREVIGIEGAPILLSVGNLVEAKGHHIAIEALATVKCEHPNARLIIVGKGPERQRLQATAERLGLADQVQFAGFLPNDQLFKWYNAADVLILASSREGWPNVLLESMACGTPVVATRVCGIPEIVTQDVAGQLVDHRDAASFAKSILEVLDRASDRTKVRSYAQAFSWDNTTLAQIALFESMTGLTKEAARA
jgi:glycosyltransferase involved in cell wall biosynthesis